MLKFSGSPYLSWDQGLGGWVQPKGCARISTFQWSDKKPPPSTRAMPPLHMAAKGNKPHLYLKEDPLISLTFCRGKKMRSQFNYRASEVHWHSDKHAARCTQTAQCAFKILMIHEVLQFALRIAFRCVLHRCGNQDIHCWKLCNKRCLTIKMSSCWLAP